MNEGIQLGVCLTSLFSLNESFILSEIIFYVKVANLSDYSTLSILSLVSALILIPNFQTQLIASFPIVFWLSLFVVVTTLHDHHLELIGFLWQSI
jgi:hypothetical protein